MGTCRKQACEQPCLTLLPCSQAKPAINQASRHVPNKINKYICNMVWQLQLMQADQWNETKNTFMYPRLSSCLGRCLGSWWTPAGHRWCKRIGPIRRHHVGRPKSQGCSFKEGSRSPINKSSQLYRAHAGFGEAHLQCIDAPRICCLYTTRNQMCQQTK